MPNSTCTPVFIAALLARIRAWNQSRCPLTDKWINKVVLYMEYYSAIKRNAFESALMRYMDLEPIIQSKVNQKEKYKYCTLTHVYGIFKDGTDVSICIEAMEMQT